MTALSRLFLRVSGRTAGSAAVEFALVAPLLIILLLGSADFGVMAYHQAQFVASARAGAQYARANFGNDSAIPAALLPPGFPASGFTRSTVCTCFTSPNAYTPSAPDSATCVSGCASGALIVYAQAAVTYGGYRPFLADFFGTWPFTTLNGQTALRVQ